MKSNNNNEAIQANRLSGKVDYQIVRFELRVVLFINLC